MSDKAAQALEVLGKPLRFLASQGYQNIHVLKNVSQHVQDHCLRASRLIQDPHRKALLKQMHQAFESYDSQDEDRQKQILQHAVDLLENLYREPSLSLGFKEKDHPSHALADIQKGYEALMAPVQYSKGVGPVLAGKLNKNNIHTLFDLLHFLPYRYEDRTTMTPIGSLKEDEKQTTMGVITYAGPTFYKHSRRKFFEVMIEDDSGELRLKWFHFHLGSFQQKFRKDQKLIVSGKVKTYKNVREIHHPDFELFTGGQETLSFGRLIPIYSELGGIYQKTLRKIMYYAVTSHIDKRKTLIPSELAKKHNMLPPWKALQMLHQPPRMLQEHEQEALARQLAWEELFFYAIAYAQRKKRSQKDGIAMPKTNDEAARVLEKLPFELTGAQKKAIEEIQQDMQTPRAMNRLLQGDVGSGKTIVAFVSALKAIINGYQVALMAPTELLALQHLQNMQTWASWAGISIDCLVGKTSTAEKARISKELQEGKLDMVVGTHALIEDYVAYQNLGLVIIDEQHRFGVRQKDRVRGRSMRPDVLIMSATPIPRSLAMSLFGDIDVSRLQEMPKGRKLVHTKVVKNKERNAVYGTIQDEVRQGRQVFMVYPLVESSEFIDAKDAVSMFEELQKGPLANLRLGLLHGQMKPDEKESIMQTFAQGKLDVLVSTTVIEVGIDVPNATLMVIEHPERFGLAQLHQLRGRVGRGQDQSECILIAPDKLSTMALSRLKKFASIYDGFELAKEDLKIRGPGDFFGVAQSGMPQFAMAKFPRDLDLLEETRATAQDIIKEDPDLQDKQYAMVRWSLEHIWKHRIAYIDVA